VSDDCGVLAAAGAYCHAISFPEQVIMRDGLVNLLLEDFKEAWLADGLTGLGPFDEGFAS